MEYMKKTVTLLIALILLVLLEGGGYFFDRAVLYPAGLHSQATAVVQSVLRTQTQATATADANSPQGIYNRVINTNPAFSDPLDKQLADTWNNQSQAGANCTYSNGAYHIRLSTKKVFFDWFSTGGDYGDFIYQVQVTIVKGLNGVGGIVFRSEYSSTTFYFFTISYNGLYGLNVEDGQYVNILAFGRSAAIKMGLNQPNLLAVMARGSTLYLYINKQFVRSISDSTFFHGAIGLCALDSDQSATDVAFSNAQVWVL